MFTLYWIAVAPGMKTIPAELLLTHKKNSDCGPIFCIGAKLRPADLE